MSTPVVASSWAGVYDCSVCRRKRLMGEEFSNKALANYRKNSGPLKCKKCVAEAEQRERDAAANKTGNADETRTCAGCKKSLDGTKFTKNQWNKGDEKAKCRSCVERALEDESKQQSAAAEAKIQAAKEAVSRASASGNSLAILKAESELAALEAQRVTGLKPTKAGRGRGRGGVRGGSGGRGRFGSGRGRGRR